MRERLRYEKRVGTIVDGKWRVDELRGVGSTAAVYAATHRNGHRAALKILHHALCADREAAERFLREAAIVNGIKHRAIVPVGDDGVTEDGCAFLVTELLEGETLDELCARAGGRLTLSELAPIAEELLSALSAVHAAGVVHRDLKPQNVFLTDGALKLLDFGTARALDRAPGTSAEGIVVGTPAFMSPEQARGARSEIDVRSDVWSLGAIFFTALTGELVHAEGALQARVLAAAQKQARKIAILDPEIHPRVAEVIDRALMFAKEDRFPDVRSMRVALREALAVATPGIGALRRYADAAAAREEVAPRDSLLPPRASMVPTRRSTRPSRGSVPPAGGRAAPRISFAPPSLPADLMAIAGLAPTIDPAPAAHAPSNAPVEIQDAPASELEAPGVSATHTSLVPATKMRNAVAACFAVAAGVLVIGLAMKLGAAGDAPRAGATPAAPPEETTAAAPAPAPEPSFIVVSAPDVPGPGRPARPSTRPAAGEPRAATSAERSSSAQAAPAEPAASAVDASAPALAPAEQPQPRREGGGIIRSADEAFGPAPSTPAPPAQGSGEGVFDRFD